MTDLESPIKIWFYTRDESFSQIIAKALGPNFKVQQFGRLDAVAVRECEELCDVAILDLRWVDTSPTINSSLASIDGMKAFSLPVPVIAMISDSNKIQLTRLLEAGAYDVIETPPDMAELRLVLRHAYRLRAMEKELRRLHSRRVDTEIGDFQTLLDSTDAMQRVVSLAQKIASCDISVLVTGETGTGKEVLSRAIHRMSPRSNAPFVAFSCANLPETLVEAELFGHERGAFTGAVGIRQGRFEVAQGGTLLLDEVGDLPLSLQPKLLRVLQERSFERLGSSSPINADFRLICATHRNLKEMIARGQFREDLYYRLNVVQLHISPLRERREGIALLAHHFLDRFAKQFGRSARRFSRLALQALEEYHWPGNVRELENGVQRAVVVADGPTIETWHLPAALQGNCERTGSLRSYEEEVRDFKRRLILHTLRDCGWCKVKTAKTLGLARGYLHRLINQLHVTPKEFESAETRGSPQQTNIRVM